MKVAKSHILVASLVLFAGAGFYYAGKRSTQSLEPVTALPELKVMEFKGTDAKLPSINLLDHVGAEPKQVQTPPSQVVSSYTPKNKSVARSLALSEAAKGNWYSSIVSEVEGFKNFPYMDNKGAAIGFGWNLGQQSVARNTELTRAIGLDSAAAGQLVALSGVQQPSSLPRASITPDQGSQAVMLMREQYEAPMRKLVPSFASLKKNEQDALVYHAYKVGGGGAAKYISMLSALKVYAADPTEANKLKVADTFTYKYTLNGKVYTDARSKLYLAALFTSPEAYTYLLGTTPAPANFNQVAKLASQKIDTSKPAESQVQDEFGDVKEELMRTGKPFNLTIAEDKPKPAPYKNVFLPGIL
ncbi:hypothetical protein [Variovorax sp. RA8]|uniref:hypothetical protein n=1 Tax=Variovorax sp. (strain JCM 16519 / RA8) TaxID=662548 RepID=UPI000A3EF658|nr:hypothetical protein [Variovorax sp. RA8]VTU34421.1 hypothetical protein RA8CHR_04970 [Variovorax sp. RA8]